MKTQMQAIERAKISSRIITLRGQKVMLDADLADLYGVTTKRLNEQVKRNRNRFPQDFMFRLTSREKAEVVANCDHLRKLKFSPVLPSAFTEHGALMAANVLNSSGAVEMSVYVIRAFVQIRRELAVNEAVSRRLAEIESTLLLHDAASRDLYAKIRPLLLPPPESKRRRIGFYSKESVSRYKKIKRNKAEQEFAGEV